MGMGPSGGTAAGYASTSLGTTGPEDPVHIYAATSHPLLHYKVGKNTKAKNRPYSPMRPRNTPYPTKSKCQTPEYIPKIVNVKIFVSYYWHNDLFVDDLCVIIGCCTTFSITLSRLCGNQNLPRHPERPTRNPELGKDLPYGNPHGLRPYEGVMQAIEY